MGQPLLRSWLIPFSRVKVVVLRTFGASIGRGVRIKPGVKVKFPWRLTVGHHCWLGEDLWIDNLAEVRIGAHCCLSQGVYLCTGSHDWSRDTFDLIINTVSAPLDMDAYLSLLRLDGTLVNVGAPPQPLPVQVFSLIGRRRSFAGSNIGGIAETQQMLDFCAERGIAPEVEVITADEVNEAYERVLASAVRYRFVIDVDSLR